MSEIGKNTTQKTISYTLYGMRVAAAKKTNEINEKKNQTNRSKEYKELQGYSEQGDINFALKNEQTKEYLNLKDRVQIDCSRTKNIVSTQINGQIGTIKEWVNNGDVAINLLITVINEKNVDAYPEQELKDIMSFLNMNRELKVYNKYLNDVMGVTRLVVTSFKHTPKIYQGMQTISVDAMSDETYVVEEELLK